MQRVRMSLPYYKNLGWEPVVLCVHEKFVSGYKDDLLSETIPADIEVHKVAAWSEKLTRRLGIGRSTLYRKLGELSIDTAAWATSLAQCAPDCCSFS